MIEWQQHLKNESIKFHAVFGFLVAIVLPAWTIFDYIAVNTLWQEIGLTRTIAGIFVAITSYLCYKELLNVIFQGYVFTLILYVGVGLWLPFLEDKQITYWCIGYSTCYITCALFQTWKIRHHIINMIVAFTLIPLSIWLFAKAPFSTYIKDGLFLTISVSLVSSGLFITRLYYMKRNFQLIREKMLLQAELSQRDRVSTIGMLSAGIAHEFGNFLAIMKECTHALKDMYDENDMDKETIDELFKLLLKSIKSSAHIITSMGNVSKSDPEVCEINLRDLINTSLILLRGKTLEKITTNISGSDEHKLFFSETFLLQVITNILLNASYELKNKYNGIIEISFQKYGDKTTIYISDNGNGISDENKKKIFEPFFTTKKDSMGIGLSLMQRNIRSLDGNIELTKQKDPTTFKITVIDQKVK